MQSRLQKQLDFIVEVDKIKQIQRMTKLFDGSRYENDAEHSWTIALMASILREHSNFEINMERVQMMLLIHDVVEIDAGDTFLYDESRDTAHIDEEKAAKRIFSILPDDQAEYLLNLWIEFEKRETNDAKFAGVFDRFEPVLQNYKTKGGSWQEHGITKAMVMKKNHYIQDGSEVIWKLFLDILDECVEKGYLKE